MGEITYKDNEPIPQKRSKKKMNKGIKALIITLISLVVVLPAILVGVAFACFYDPSHKDVDYYKGYTMQKTFNAMMVDALDDTTVTKQLDLKTTEKHLNTMFKAIFGDEPEEEDVVKNFYVMADNGTYTFKFEIGAFKYLKTTVELKTELTIEDQPDCDVLVFNITDLKIGRVRGFLKLKDSVIKRIPTDEIDDIFADTGLSMKIDFDNLCITYKSTDFYDDIVNLLGSDKGDFVQIFSEILVAKDLREIYYKDDTIFGVKVDIDKLKTTSGLHEIENLDIKSGTLLDDGINDFTVSEIKKFLDQGKLKEDDPLEVVGKFIIGGYGVLKDSEKIKLDTVGSKLYGATYRTREPLYNYTLEPEKTIKQVVHTQIVDQIPVHPEHITAYISTTNLNDMLRHSKGMGSINYFTRNIGTDEEPNYKVNYVALDNYTAIISGEYIYIAMNVNYNGYYGQMTMQCERIPPTPETPYGLMQTHINDIYMGNHKVSEKTKNAFLSSITNSLDVALFKVTGDLIDFNIKATMESDGVLESLYDLEFTTINNTSIVDGNIKIDATLKVSP